MFKDDYTELFENCAPSPALKEETVALMAEAQSHPAPKLLPAPKKKWILPVAAGSVAAAVAVAVGLSVWLDKPQVMDDKKGDLDAVLGSVAFPEKEPIIVPSTNAGDSAPEAMPQGQDTGTDEAAPEDATDSAEPPIDYQSAPLEDAAPVIINDRNTETYRSLKEFIVYLGDKQTIGYKTNYIADPALVVVPTFLPQTARFRHLHMEDTGAYTYSYVINKEGKQYFLDISLNASFPKAQRDIKIRTDAIKRGEVIDYDRKENTRIYYIGKYEKATVTVTALSGDPVTAEMVDAILVPFELGRYAENNPYLELRYDG